MWSRVLLPFEEVLPNFALPLPPACFVALALSSLSSLSASVSHYPLYTT